MSPNELRPLPEHVYPAGVWPALLAALRRERETREAFAAGDTGRCLEPRDGGHSEGEWRWMHAQEALARAVSRAGAALSRLAPGENAWAVDRATVLRGLDPEAATELARLRAEVADLRARLTDAEAHARAADARAAQPVVLYEGGFETIRRLRRTTKTAGAGEAELACLDRLETFRATAADLDRLRPLARLAGVTLPDEDFAEHHSTPAPTGA